MATQRTNEELKALLLDSRKVLRLGALRDSEEWLNEQLEKHEVAHDELRTVMYSELSQSRDEEDFFDRAVNKITDMLHGDDAVAETFVILDSLDCTADRIFENLHAQSHMQRNGTHSGPEADKLAEQLTVLRNNLSQVISYHSGSSPFIVNTVVDGYISSLSSMLDIKSQGQQR